MSEKSCSFCYQKKPIEEFDDAETSDGKEAICSACKHGQVQRVEPRTSPKPPVRGLGRRKRGRLPKNLYARDPLHVLAWRAVGAAMRSGALVRPRYCDRCGLEQARLEAHHHHGYLEEHWTDVVWLCKGCHDRHRGQN